MANCAGDGHRVGREPWPPFPLPTPSAKAPPRHDGFAVVTGWCSVGFETSGTGHSRRLRAGWHGLTTVSLVGPFGGAVAADIHTCSMAKKHRKPRAPTKKPVRSSTPPRSTTKAVVPVRSLDVLGRSLYKDLDGESYGLRWMEGNVATRVLLSDHLIGALETLGQNLKAAECHLEGFELATARLDGLTTRYWKKEARKAGRVPSPIAPDSPEREKWLRRRDCDLSAFFGPSGPFSNLGTAIVIVAALPTEVVERFTWGMTVRAFENVTGSPCGRTEQQELANFLGRAIDQAGPPGWIGGPST